MLLITHFLIYVDAGRPLVVSSVTSFDEAAIESMMAQVGDEENEEYEDNEQQLPANSGFVFAEDSGDDDYSNEEENNEDIGIFLFIRPFFLPEWVDLLPYIFFY